MCNKKDNEVSMHDMVNSEFMGVIDGDKLVEMLGLPMDDSLTVEMITEALQNLSEEERDRIISECISLDEKAIAAIDNTFREFRSARRRLTYCTVMLCLFVIVTICEVIATIRGSWSVGMREQITAYAMTLACSLFWAYSCRRALREIRNINGRIICSGKIR